MRHLQTMMNLSDNCYWNSPCPHTHDAAATHHCDVSMRSENARADMSENITKSASASCQLDVSKPKANNSSYLIEIEMSVTWTTAAAAASKWVRAGKCLITSFFVNEMISNFQLTMTKKYKCFGRERRGVLIVGSGWVARRRGFELISLILRLFWCTDETLNSLSLSGSDKSFDARKSYNFVTQTYRRRWNGKMQSSESVELPSCKFRANRVDHAPFFTVNSIAIIKLNCVSQLCA